MMQLEKLPRPCGKKVVVEVSELAERTESGLYIPETAKDKHRSKEGIVRGTGNDCVLGLKEGDYVFFDEWVGTRLYINGKDHLYVLEDAILGIKYSE